MIPDQLQKTRSSSFLYRARVLFLIVAIVGISLSISVTSVALSLTLFFWLLSKGLSKIGHKKTLILGKERELSPREKKAEKIPKAFLLSLALFGVIFIAELYHVLFSPYVTPSLKSVLLVFKSGDFLLLLFSILVWHLSREESELKIIRKSFMALTFLLIISGVASLFSEIPLSSFFLNEKEYTPQNALFTLGESIIYSPEGFMSNRLSYAGMLMLVLIYLLGEVLENFSQRKIMRSFFYGLFFLLGFCVLWLTGVRSALLGFSLSLTLLLSVRLWRLRSNLRFPAFVRINKQKKVPVYAFFVGFCLLILTFTALGLHFGIHKDILRPVLRTSNFGRALMWSESGEIIKEHPLLGVGSTNYPYVSLEWRQNFLQSNPDTWYFSLFIPKGHMHSDLLDLWYNYGFLAVFFFLAIFFVILQYIFYPAHSTRLERRNTFLLGGCVALFFGGFAQCYLMDNEVGFIFWLSLALGLRTGPKISLPS